MNDDFGPLTYSEVMELWQERELFSRFPKLRLPVVNDELYYFDQYCAAEAVDFFENELEHVEGPQAGEKFKLEEWQMYVVAMLYGWKEKTFDENGGWINTFEQRERDLRKFRETLIFIPRKNGKSFLGAGFGLKGLFNDNEPGARVVSAAAEREQAALIFDVAKKIVDENPNFSQDSESFRRSVS